jgi:hypothetical protein
MLGKLAIIKLKSSKDRLHPKIFIPITLFCRQLYVLSVFLAIEFNQSLLIVTHDNEFAEKTDRIIEMEDGTIIRM